MRGTRIVPPTCLQTDIIDLAHEGHQGIVKTKERLQTKCGGLAWIGKPNRDAYHVMVANLLASLLHHHRSNLHRYQMDLGNI